MPLSTDDLMGDMLLSLDALEGVEPARPESKSDSGWWDAVLDQAAVAPTGAAANPSDDDLIADLRETLADTKFEQSRSMGFHPVRISEADRPADRSKLAEPVTSGSTGSGPAMSNVAEGTGWNPMLPAGGASTGWNPMLPAGGASTGWNPMLPAGGVWNDFTVRDRLFAKLVAADLPALRDIDIYVERGVISIRAVVVASAPLPMPAPMMLPPVPAPTNVLPQVGAVAGWGFPQVPVWPMQPHSVAWDSIPCTPTSDKHSDSPKTKDETFDALIRESMADESSVEAVEGSEHAHANTEDARAGSSGYDKSKDARDGIPCYDESDDAVRERIIASLEATQIPALMALEVQVKGQAVTLNGAVTSDYERQLVLQMVRRECDAWHVRNGIAVVAPKVNRFQKLAELSRDVWQSYQKETLTVAALLIAVAGYAMPWPKFSPARTYPVTTDAVFEKEPMAGATIVLHPSNWELPESARPSGKVDSQGKVTFSTFGDKDGVPAGEYVVTARWSKLIKTPDGEAVPGPNVIPPQFADPSKSPVRFRVDTAGSVIPIVFSNKLVSRSQ